MNLTKNLGKLHRLIPVNNFDVYSEMAQLK
jgi:hypothetical protein